MKYPFKRLLSVAVVSVLVLLIISALLIGWFYLSPLSVFKEKVAEALPVLPAALVDGQPIPFRDVLAREAVSSSTPDEILAEMVTEKQIAIVAKKYGVDVSNTQLNSQLYLLKQQPNFSALLSSYNLTGDGFENNVLKPQLLYNNLELWFNGQRSLNPAAYAVEDTIKQQMAQNTASGTFVSLVQEYSHDSSTKLLDGNLGFVEISSLWPEFQGAVESAGPGSVVAAAGRDGLYIFQIQAKDNNGPGSSPRAELAEIYLPGENFQGWYNNEIKSIKIKVFNLY